MVRSITQCGNSISPTELTTLINVEGKHKVTYEVRSGIVIVRGSSLGDASTGGTNAGGSKNIDIGTMPEGLRPSEETFFYLSGRGGSTGNQANKIVPNGTIRLYNTSSSINWWNFTCVYPVGQFSISQFSTDEINTGRKWIDGKSIYRKTIHTGPMMNGSFPNGSKNVAHGISNIDTVIEEYGYMIDSSDRFLPFPRIVTGAITSQLSLGCNSTDIIIWGNSPGSSILDSYVTVEYTKK